MRSRLFLVGSTLLVPLLVVALGLWQAGRADADLAALEKERYGLEARYDAARALTTPGDVLDPAIRFERGETLYIGDYALTMMGEAIAHLDRVVVVAELRRVLAPFIVLGGSLSFALGLAILAGGAILAARGLRSRARLLAGFTLVRGVLPGALVALILVNAVVVLGITAFETSQLFWVTPPRNAQILVIVLASVAVGMALFTAFQALSRLGDLSGLFTPEPHVLIARAIGRDEAEGLWSIVMRSAGQLGAPVPDTIAIGLTHGFFVSSGPVRLLPGSRALTGNTLHLPLGLLAVLEPDEAETVIAHELAHFAGADTEYTRDFLPIYRTFERSLGTVASAGRARDGSLSPVALPALALGFFVADRFHLAVRHWSRVRELESDRLSATLTSVDAAGRALLRTSVMDAPIGELVRHLWNSPEGAPEDLVAFFPNYLPGRLESAMASVFGDRDALLGAVTPHPTDSHPPIGARMAAIGFSPRPEHFAAATTLPDAGRLLARYFADPRAICIAVTGDLREAARAAQRDEHRALVSAASAVTDEAVALCENTMPIAIFMACLAALLAGAGGFMITFGLPGFSRLEPVIPGITFLVAGGFILLIGIMTVDRARRPYLRLFPDRIEHRGLDRPLYWADIEAAWAADHAGTVVTQIVLEPSAVFPKRVGWGGRGRLRIERKTRTIVIRAVPPRGYKAMAYIALVARYAEAASARRALAGRSDPPGAAL